MLINQVREFRPQEEVKKERKKKVMEGGFCLEYKADGNVTYLEMSGP